MITTIVPTIDPNLQQKEVNLIGEQEFTIRPYPSTSYSQNNATFSFSTPNAQVFINRCIYCSIPVTIAYAGSTTGSVMLQSAYDALRCYPLQSVINNIQMTINDRQFTVQTSQILHPLTRFMNQNKGWHMTPTYTDKYQVYSDGVAANNNPLGNFLNASIDGTYPRGAFPMTITNGATSASIATTITEPLLIPPLLAEDDSMGFTNVTTMSFNINYSPTLSRIVSHAASLATISSITVTMGQPTLYLRYFTPPASYVPRPVSYNSSQINYFPTPNATLTAGSSAVIASTNIQLNLVPSHMYVFCREADANLSYTTSDTYTNISAITCNFNNKSGILSTASEYDLMCISQNNHWQGTWEDWHGVTNSATLGTYIGTSGSVLKLVFGKDIPLLDGDYVGKASAYNLQMNVTVKNVSSASITQPTLYIIVVSPTRFTINLDTHTDLQIGLNPSEVSRGVQAGEYLPYSAMSDMFGAGFWDDLKDWGHNAIKWLKDNKIVSSIANAIPHPIAQQVGKVAENLGFGDGGMQVGGKKMTRKELIALMGKH